MAIGLLIYSIKYILKKELSKYILVCLVASFIHAAAVLFVPFYWLSRIKIPRQVYLYSVAIAMLIQPFLAKINQSYIVLSKFLNEPSLRRYYHYLLDESVAREVSLIDLATIQRILILVLFVALFQKLRIDPDAKRLFLNGYVISILLFVVFSNSLELATRISYSFKIFDIFILSSFITISYKKEIRLIVTFCVIAYSLISITRTLGIPDGGLLPYDNSMFRLLSGGQ
jgi:hypothetical protein